MKVSKKQGISLFAFFIMLIPYIFNTTLFELSLDATKVIFIFIGAIIMWLFVAIDWPSILILCMLSTLSITTPNDIIKNAFGNATIWFLVFSFLLTYVLSKTGFLKRCALFFINSEFAKKSNFHFAVMFWLSVLCVGSFIAPTVVFLLFYSLLEEIYNTYNIEKGSSFANMLMLGTTFTTSISCAMTPIAHTFPLMALGFYEKDMGTSIAYLEYMKLSIPLCLLIFGIMLIVFKLLFKQIENEKYQIKNIETNKISKEEIISCIVFILVVFMWVSPEFLKPVLPDFATFLSGMGTTLPAMIGVVILSFININNKPILDVKDGMKNGITWNSIILCATTLCLGSYLTNNDLGITQLIIGNFEKYFYNDNVFIILLLISAIVCIMTNLMSNIVTVTVSYSILMPIILSVNPNLAVICTIIIGMLASLAFATPPAIAHVAIAAGSGWTNSKELLKYGSVLTVISIFLTAILATIII